MQQRTNKFYIQIQYIIIWIAMVLGVFFSKRMEIPPNTLLDSGSVTFMRLIFHNMFSTHKIYFFGMLILVSLILYVYQYRISVQDLAKSNKWIWSCAFLFSFLKLICVTYDKCFTGTLLYHFSKPIVMSNACLWIGYFCFYGMLLELIVYYVDKCRGKIEINGKTKESGNAIVAVILMLLCWLPYLILYYPGTVESDALAQLSQFWGDSVLKDHHPVYSTLLMGVFSWIGNGLYDMNLGVFLYVIFQAILSAIVFIQIAREYCKAGLGKWSARALWCFFAVFPLWASFIQLLDKDMLFAIVVAELTLWLNHNIDRETEWRLRSKKTIVFILLCLNVTFLRKNGLYAVIFTLIVMVFVLREKRRTVMITTGFFLCTYLLINTMLFQVFGVEKGSIREALSIPFQQTARYIKEYGDEISAKERVAIDAVLDYDSIAKGYAPYLSDPVKNTYKEGSKEELKEYFKVWFTQLLKHPFVYADATISNSYAYLCADAQWLWAYSYFDMPENTYDIHYVFSEGARESVKEWNMNFIWLPVVHYFYAPGFYAWIILFCCAYNWQKKQGRRIIVAIPSLTLILTCMASPCLNSLRYALPVFVCTPLIVLASCRRQQLVLK